MPFNMKDVNEGEGEGENPHPILRSPTDGGTNTRKPLIIFSVLLLVITAAFIVYRIGYKSTSTRQANVTEIPVAQVDTAVPPPLYEPIPVDSTSKTKEKTPSASTSKKQETKKESKKIETPPSPSKPKQDHPVEKTVTPLAGSGDSLDCLFQAPNCGRLLAQPPGGCLRVDRVRRGWSPAVLVHGVHRRTQAPHPD